jgi:hypothetical protein
MSHSIHKFLVPYLSSCLDLYRLVRRLKTQPKGLKTRLIEKASQFLIDSPDVKAVWNMLKRESIWSRPRGLIQKL